MAHACSRATFALLFLLCCSAASADDRQYGIKADLPEVGTMFRKYVVKGSVIPINKRYHELTADEKKFLHSMYENMPEGDEPPFPSDGLKPIYDYVNKAQQKLLVSGELILVVTVDSAGQASSVKTIGSPSEDMTRFVASVLMLTKYKPAVCGGSPCRMDYPFRFNFEVN